VPEIARQLSPENTLYPNPKSLYVRLLAETGLIGFMAFFAFQLGLLGDSFAVLKQGTSMGRYLGTAAIFTWLALLIYNMTQDSLATPNLWLNLGILTGMAGVRLAPDNSAPPHSAVNDGAGMHPRRRRRTRGGMSAGSLT
jgi:O-antigen ligase